jgi:hypothetical protein
MENNYQSKLRDHFDGWSIIVVTLTFVLFAVALFVKGFTHDLLLEAGVFLVSVKLILSSYSNSVALKKLDQQLTDVKQLLNK